MVEGCFIQQYTEFLPQMMKILVMNMTFLTLVFFLLSFMQLRKDCKLSYAIPAGQKRQAQRQKLMALPQNLLQVLRLHLPGKRATGRRSFKMVPFPILSS